MPMADFRREHGARGSTVPTRCRVQGRDRPGSGPRSRRALVHQGRRGRPRYGPAQPWQDVRTRGVRGTGQSRGVPLVPPIRRTGQRAGQGGAVHCVPERARQPAQPGRGAATASRGCGDGRLPSAVQTGLGVQARRQRPRGRPGQGHGVASQGCGPRPRRRAVLCGAVLPRRPGGRPRRGAGGRLVPQGRGAGDGGGPVSSGSNSQLPIAVGRTAGEPRGCQVDPDGGGAGLRAGAVRVGRVTPQR
mmetsp:Transcript_42396/g.113423  ORF Transcript_42396/g.113423 Transcript_42396/m.113423 type:complete len:246 (+) Transcript_42396:496-1233(+)